MGMGGQGLLNTRLALLLPHVAVGQVIGIFLCKTFFEQIPVAVVDAARVDGASEFRIYRSVILPQALPVLATIFILSFVGVYNDYIWPLLVISDPAKQVFAVGVTMLQREDQLEMGPMMAG